MRSTINRWFASMYLKNNCCKIKIINCSLIFLVIMIRSLVKSAFQTGCLSVASEGLIHQVLTTRCYQSNDLVALAALNDEIIRGKIKREAPAHNLLKFDALNNHR